MIELKNCLVNIKQQSLTHSKYSLVKNLSPMYAVRETSSDMAEVIFCSLGEVI